jgi:hypothetical protein
MNADSIKIECDEDGFHLIVQTDDPFEHTRFRPETRFDFRLPQDCAEALHEQVNLIIGSWLAERESARYSVRVTEEDLEGYSLGDPKRIELQHIIDRGGFA